MWSQLILCALVGFAAASNNGWQYNNEYVYQVRGRTLTGLHDVANQYSGIVMRAKLALRPQEDESFTAKISNAKYAQVHENLPEGWKSEIPEGHLKFQDFHLSEKPFQIKMKNGVVDQLVIDSEVENWEANIIKSFVSQMQLDTRAENVVKSHINQLPEEDSNNAVYKTMEDTVTGVYETLYDVAPLPKYVLASQPWLAPMAHEQQGELIEIVKNKNFSSAQERPGYYYGLGGMGDFEPATNQMKDFFLRSSLSRAIVSGSLKHYIIQSSTTTNKIILSPTLNSEESGMVVSHLNMTLSDVTKCSGPFEMPQQLEKLESLSYIFNTPFEQSQKVKSQGHQRQDRDMYSSEEERVHYTRHPRSLKQQESSEESAEQEQGQWEQQEAQLSQPPNSPLLPLYVGYKGQSVKYSKKVDIVETAQKIAQQIGKEIEHPEHIPKEQTLAKYVILSTVARVMSQEEMQTVAEKLYTQEEQGPKAQAWYAYRDAIAESGTGPGLMTVKEWIKSKKIASEEAAEVIAAMAQSTRQPTANYIEAFGLLLNENEDQAILNDTALLSFTTLVRKVYVDEKYAHNEYPEHSFGKFSTESGKKYVEEHLIPKLTDELHRAIKHADSHKVLVYIRALGNVAHQRILEAFEPYLEGEKQCSQFQRLQMVLALDQLVVVEPKVARSVLYKIYQNQGEQQEVRVAAVYQLMRCGPSAAMLQRMAKYTNIDTDEQVNAAVKSAIESAAELETEEYSELAENARAAQPLLTTEEYGAQYSGKYLRDFVQEEMNLSYEQIVHVYGSQDSIVPKGIKYILRAGLGGARRPLINVQAMVSSIDQLTNVFERQTQQYHKDNKQQKSAYQQAQKNQWSSESIAKLLKIENVEREELEGSVLLQLADGVTRYFTFNNQTIDDLSNDLQQYEQELREGKQFQFTKFLNRYEIAVSFPTEMGMPFLYTLDAPTLLHMQGQIRAIAEPKAFHEDSLRRPDSITAHAEIHSVVSTQISAKLGFITPFDHQQYVSGYDKNIHANIPLKSKIEIDIKKGEVQAQLQAIQPEKNTQLFHYSSWPYTSQYDILDLQPVANHQQTQIIYSEEGLQSQYHGIVGEQTGMAFRVDYASEQKFLDAYWLYQQYQRNDAVSAWLAPLYDETIMHTKLDVYYAADHSTSRQVQIRAGYVSHQESEQGQGPKPEISQFSELPKESKARQQQFAKMAANGIHSAQAYAADIEFEFEGPKKAHYRATVAQASSPVDPKARALIYLTKKSANQQAKPFGVSVVAKTVAPNTNGLDFNYALKFDPTTRAEIEIALGEDYESAAKFHVQAKLEQSEARRQYLKHHPRAEECREEMKEGNQQLPACANMTQEANLLDRAHFQVQYKNIGAQARNMTKKMYNALRYLAFYNLEENRENATGSQSDDKIDIHVRFEPDFESANVTLQAPHLDAHIDNIRVNSWAKQVVAIHPVFGLESRVMSEVFGYDTFRPFCVVDQQAANTFDNKTYPLDLGNDWTVMFQYVPDYARTGEQEENYQQQQQEYQHEQYSVLVRDADKDHKEVKMTIRTPETEGRVIEIELKPDQQQSEHNAKVYVNQKQYQINDQQATEIEDGLVQMYVLPDGDIKVEVEDSFYIIYDGERVKITPTHDKFRDAVRGLCGTFTGEESDDFLTPKNCIIADHEDFVKSYSLSHGADHKYKSECYYEEQVYVNVISDRDAGRQQPAHKSYRNNNHSGRDSQEDSCTEHQTSYVEHEGQICFTVRPVPVCKQSCNGGEMIEKRVAVHCVKDTNVARLWQKQIQNGGSPDFSQKDANNHLKIRVPESCSRGTRY